MIFLTKVLENESDVLMNVEENYLYGYLMEMRTFLHISEVRFISVLSFVLTCEFPQLD